MRKIEETYTISKSPKQSKEKQETEEKKILHFTGIRTLSTYSFYFSNSTNIIMTQFLGI